MWSSSAGESFLFPDARDLATRATSRGVDAASANQAAAVGGMLAVRLDANHAGHVLDHCVLKTPMTKADLLWEPGRRGAMEPASS
jgi:hypothetical protein